MGDGSSIVSARCTGRERGQSGTSRPLLEPALGALVGLLALFLLAAAPKSNGEGEPGSRYGETPEELVPFRDLGEPYARFFLAPPEFRGPGRELAEPEGVEQVTLGVLLPLEGADAGRGRRMRQGIELALAEANRDGGYLGAPFVAIYRDESQEWGAGANAAVELVFDHAVWALIGALDDDASHVVARVLLKLETPLVNTGGTDPTLTEHLIPWLVRMRPDDRQTGYRLASEIFLREGHGRMVVFRSNDRYGRVGVVELVDAARRLQRPIPLEVRFAGHEASWTAQIERIRGVDPDAIVLWGPAASSGRVLAALRSAGLTQPVFGPDRLMDPDFLQAAGAAAEGVTVTYPLDPEGSNPAWRDFAHRYRETYGEAPEAVAGHAYDGAKLVIDAVREAGLNRVRIRDHLFDATGRHGVTGAILFDQTRNNVRPIHRCRVVEGRFRCDRDGAGP